MSLSSYVLHSEFTYNDDGELKTNKATIDGLVHANTQVQFVELGFIEIIETLETMQTLTEMMNKHAINSFLVEKIGNHQYHALVAFHIGSFDGTFNEDGLLTLPSPAPPKLFEEKIERFKVIQMLTALMNKGKLVKVTLSRV